ncbi:hypothetical protein BJ742DRAFT_767328 [Cladochytrium replicatum]|nr:hypothetical protein BJ742DRAFT_767328 [Cladochytrium replicatum]
MARTVVVFSMSSNDTDQVQHPSQIENLNDGDQRHSRRITEAIDQLKQLLLGDPIDRSQTTQTLLDDDLFVTFCVQGCDFVLQRQFVLDHDWMLAKMITSEVPSLKLNGKLYLDADPASFRMIVAFLQRIAHPNDLASRLSGPDLELLISTSRYLLCDEIVSALNVIATERDALLSRIAELNERTSSLQERVRELETKEADSLHLMDDLQDLPFSVIQCNARKAYRSMNRCGGHSLIFGSLVMNKRSGMECNSCDGDVCEKAKDMQRMKIKDVRDAIAMVKRNQYD